MKTREKFINIFNFKPIDSLPVVEWACWWNETTDLWMRQGLPETENGTELMRYFGIDLLVQEWFRLRGKNFPAPSHHCAGIVSSLQEYEKLKQAGMLFKPEFIDTVSFDRYFEEHVAGNVAFWFTLEGFFWFPRTLLGVQEHLFAFYDQPELIHRMNQDLISYYKIILEKVLAKYQPEFMTFAEDMSYNNGAMISEDQFNEFMLPYYQELIPIIKKHGTKVFIDSDGDITECVHWFKRAGIEGILPLERQAGVDISALRRNHPEFLFLGAFDKTIMHMGEAAIRREFERLMPTARQGGCIISCDHQTPPAVSLADYKLYLRLFREYAKLS